MTKTETNSKRPTHRVYAVTKAEGAGIRRRCRRTSRLCSVAAEQLSLF
jgi:hypothetical protein